MPDNERRRPADGLAHDPYWDGPLNGEPLYLGDKFSTPEDAWIRLDPETLLPLTDGIEGGDDPRDVLPDRFSIPAGGFEVLDGVTLLPIPQIHEAPRGGEPLSGDWNLHGYPEGTPPDGGLSGCIASGPFDVIDGRYTDTGLHLRWWFEEGLWWIGYATPSRYRSWVVEDMAQVGGDLVAQKVGPDGPTPVVFRASAVSYADLRPICYPYEPGGADGPRRPITLPCGGPEGGEPLPDDWQPGD